MIPESNSDAEPRLIIIRGNSGSGKTSVAHEIRARYGRRGLAIVSQDMLRREILRSKDDAGNAAIGLIDLTTRHALRHGYHVIVEGIMYGELYGEMLTALLRDHTGPAACFYYDLPFEETVRRHAGKPKAAEFGSAEMAQWFRDRDLIPGLNETILGPEVTLGEAVELMMQAVSLPEHKNSID